MVKSSLPARSPPPKAAGSERNLWSDMLLLSSIDSLTNGTRPLGSINRKNSSEMQVLLQTATQLPLIQIEDSVERSVRIPSRSTLNLQLFTVV